MNASELEVLINQVDIAWHEICEEPESTVAKNLVLARQHLITARTDLIQHALVRGFVLRYADEQWQVIDVGSR